jgi:hypothetical protein
MSITIKGVTSGGVDLKAPDTGSNTTITLPSATGTLLPTDGDGSGLTNLTSANLVGSLPALDGSALTGVAPTKATIEALGIAASSITGALPAISGASLTGLPAGGKVLQVVSVEKSDTYTTTSTSFVDITGFSATITPSSTTSKILVAVQTGISQVVTGYTTQVRLLRGSTAINVGDTASSRTRVSAYMHASNYIIEHVSLNYLDEPSTTSATTYKMQMMEQGGGTGTLNRTGADPDGSYIGRTSSTITLMEIGA